MNLSVVLCFYLVIQIEYVASNITSTRCKNPPGGVEALDGHDSFLTFILPMNNGINDYCEVTAPLGTSVLGIVNNKDGTISRTGTAYSYSIIKDYQGTILEYSNERCKKIVLKLQNFESSNAGSWEVMRSYDRYSENGSYARTLRTHDYINVYIVKFDESLHGRRVEVKIGEYIVMYMNGKSPNNTACELRHNKTDMTYDLKEDSYEFSKKQAAIQRIGTCGFRMYVGNSSAGEWIFTGQFGWTRQRAIFQVNINSTLNRVQTKLVANPDPFNEDFSNTLHLLQNDHRSAYWEVERPDGYIIQSSDMFLKNSNSGRPNTAGMNVAFGQTTSDDEGLWKVRVGYQNDSYLREQKIFISVMESPVPEYSLIKLFNEKNGRSSFLLKATLKMYQAPLFCSFMSQDGIIFDSKISKDFSYPFPSSSCSLELKNMEGHTDPEKWEVSFDFQDSKIIGSFTIESSRGKYTVSSSHCWYKVRPKKYVKRGEEFKVKCAVSQPLAECVLESVNGTRYIYGDNPFLTMKKCTEQGGSVEKNCGCIITIPKANGKHNGNWTCHMKFEGGPTINSTVQILVTESFIISEVERKNNTVKLICRTYPTMYYDKIRNCEWMHPKEGRIFTENSTMYIATIEDNVCSLQLKGPSMNDIGEWICFARLHYEGEVNATLELLQISTSFPKEQKTDIVPVGTSKPSLRTVVVFLVALLLILLEIVTMLVYNHDLNKKRHAIRIEEAQMNREIVFEVTEDHQFNITDFLHKEGDSLPYNEERWEYPIQKLEFKKELGRGEFGIVEKYMAPDIMKDGKDTWVAVKRVRNPPGIFALMGSCDPQLRALGFELKICSNLGYHPNVVNFLGACTKGPTQNFRAIFEFCPFRSLEDYILKHKLEFVDQIEPMISGVTDPSACEYFRSCYDQQRNDKSPSRASSGETSAGAPPEGSSFRKSSDEISAGALPDGSSSGTSSNEPSRRDSFDEFDVIMPALSDISYDSDEIQGHIRTILKPFSTGDLLIWASEISKGMEYLSEKKIVHGDLATRNVLLTASRVAKISDFGLSRYIPEGYYRNQMNEKWPFINMPIESLREKKFSTNSDVWSFGVLLWECFTLGKDPYGTPLLIENPPKLLALLETGYRLEKPLYAPQKLYDVMRLCWSKKPDERPSFSHLRQEIRTMLNEERES